MTTLPSNPPAPTDAPAPETKRATWAKRAGAGVFLFFLIKGLLWLLVPPIIILGARFFAN